MKQILEDILYSLLILLGVIISYAVIVYLMTPFASEIWGPLLEGLVRLISFLGY